MGKTQALELDKSGFIYLFLNFFMEVQLIYNVVLISAVQQSDSVIHIYTFFFKILLSIMVYHSILNIVPCAIVGPCCLSILYIIVCIC